MALQALEGLSDREASSALRRDIAWKVACGLRLDDEGFHPTVLVYWRARRRTSPRPRRIFDAVRQVVEATGVLRGRGSAGAGLHDPGRCRGHPGHRHPVGRGEPSYPPPGRAGPPGRAVVAPSTDHLSQRLPRRTRSSEPTADFLASTDGRQPVAEPAWTDTPDWDAIDTDAKQLRGQY
jgi:hypothetical protein